MLNKSINSEDIKQIVVKIKKMFDAFDPDVRVFVLSNGHKIQLFDKFSAVIFICLTRFSQL